MAEDSGNDEFALCYFNENELPYIHPAARAYTLYDRWFCSLLTSTWPNRYYKWSGQSGGIITNYPEPPAGNTLGVDLRPRALQGRQRALLLLGHPVLGHVRAARNALDATRSRDYYSDCAAGTLPNITLRRPGLRRGSSPTASRPTSTRSATCASARRSWPTS